VQHPNPAQVVAGVGRRIAELRLARGWTQEEAARRLNVTVRHMKRLEAGHNMTIHTAARVALAFGVAVGELFVPPKSWDAREPGRPRRAALARRTSFVAVAESKAKKYAAKPRRRRRSR